MSCSNEEALTQEKKKNVYMHQFQTPSSKNLLPLAIGLITAEPQIEK